MVLIGEIFRCDEQIKLPPESFGSVWSAAEHAVITTRSVNATATPIRLTPVCARCALVERLAMSQPFAVGGERRAMCVSGEGVVIEWI